MEDRFQGRFQSCFKGRAQTITNMEDMEENNDVVDITPKISDNNSKSKADQGSKCSPSRYQKYYKQAYRTSWESQPDFQGWLRGVEGQPSRAYCSYCQVTLFAHRLSLLKHTCTRKHQKAAHRVFLMHSEGGNANDTETAGDDDSVEEIDSQIYKNQKFVDQPVSLTNKLRETERLETMEKIDPPNKVQLRLKQKSQPASGMTVTIIREDGTADPLQFAVTELSDVNKDISKQAPAPLTVVKSSQPEVKVEGSNHATDNSIMSQSRSSPLTTHVLDTSKGAPVHGIKVSLYRLIDGRWTLVNESITSPDGRCNELIEKANFVSGRYKLHFDVDRYFELQRQESMYPFVEIVFDVHTPQMHHHIPLLISPFGYTTYRGS